MFNTTEIGVLPIGVVNPDTGKTEHEWNLYESGLHKDSSMYLMSGGYLILASKGSLSLDQVVILRNNDTKRRIKDSSVIASCNNNREEVLGMLLKNGYDYYPARAFKKKRFPDKLSTSYSLKGFL